ncbi:MAG: RsiV family protein [Candidatus Azobacteroides sp.]|nr:RsiV family protein [Candidatus Azobacteroides sp.]
MKRYFVACLFLSIIGVALLGTSCRKKHSLSGDNEIKFDSVRITAIQYLFNDTTKPNCNLDLQFVYPAAYKNKKILDSIRVWFIECFFGKEYSTFSPEQAADRFKADYLAEYKNVEKEYSDDQARNADEEFVPVSWYSYYLTGNVKIEFNKNDLLCFLVYNDIYNGGEHGVHSYLYYTLNLETGERLTEKDIFKEDYQEELSNLLVTALEKQNNVSSREELSDLGYVGAIELLSNDNFIIGEEGITYLYNEYEIASYLMGAVKIFIPYSSMKEILKPGTSVAELAGM